ncbi:MAG: 16S rRNA (uracil(1498)-N(3))-methyltransferase, partial [Proteobacteria bacterium]|nr:16S rRNA (uracil(1498)-N(3))-methyltransferase [Pseudomonadota bacterium]
MPGHRFFVDSAPGLSIEQRGIVMLSEGDSHHARDVLRLNTGDTVSIVFRPNGRCFSGTIESVAPSVTVRLGEQSNALPQPSRVRRLLFALCKGDRNDLVCEKATELGVGSVHFFQAERSVVRLDSPADCEKKRTRWTKIAESAAKQSSRATVPEVLVSRSLKEALDTLPPAAGDRLLYCALTIGSKEIRSIVPPDGFIHLCIGPEGDLSPSEEALLAAHHGEPLSLGPTVLRSET